MTGGEKKFSEEVMEAVDERKGSITYKVFEECPSEVYNSFKFILSIESNGEDNHVVTWALEYEKKTESVADRHELMDLCIVLNKEIDRHYSLVRN
ncbi:hypothetical protein Sango_1111000 [Sesamum angolense]|uniref:Bet v I/Major latex protein domain-containing protein n=1 Tax=Sesamum angolense TaxID=2727404 RepID=A0AAE1WVM9_9LAMI|nr:hypothetical protein Sango_1111000 [Sesamum angolense]